MGSLGATVVRAVATGPLRSALPVLRGTCTSAMVVFIRSTAATDTTGSRCARFSNIVKSNYLIDNEGVTKNLAT